MRHLHLIVDHEPSPCDFPPTWDDFSAARRRFLDRLATDATPRDGGEAERLGDGEAEPTGEVVGA
jgi:hypothetical protein